MKGIYLCFVFAHPMSELFGIVQFGFPGIAEHTRIFGVMHFLRLILQRFAFLITPAMFVSCAAKAPFPQNMLISKSCSLPLSGSELCNGDMICNIGHQALP